MKTRRKMRADVNEVLRAITTADIDDKLQFERGKLEDIIDELNSESSTEFIYDTMFDLGAFASLKRAVDKAIKLHEKEKVAKRIAELQNQ